MAGRAKLERAARALAVADLALVLAFATMACWPREAPAVGDSTRFAQSPKDRPVLETVRQVWQARTTGVAEFDFDGDHYIVYNLPKEYVDYSSWYVRMP